MEHRRREPAPGVFRLVLPLPFPGLERVNAVLLADDGGSTLVDCGISDQALDDDGWPEVVAALAVCDLEPSDIARVIVTHTHIDHYGMAGRVVEASGCELVMHAQAEEELDLYRDPDRSARRLAEMLGDHGVGEDDLRELTQYEDWRGFVSSVVSATTTVTDGETFDIGGRSWQIVHTPGHARSHVCLWSASDRIVISGDHVLPTITPHIDFRRGEDADPLGEFLDSLARFEHLDPALVLPGHGHPFEEGAERARVIARHHDRRLGSILQVIRREPRTASQITDEIFGTTLLNFARRLALGETLAHLVYLSKRGEIERVQDESGTYVYKKVSRRTLPAEDD